jgi:hypothetical protein
VPWNDILHPDFAVQIDAFMREHVAPRANDPHLLGWCSDNELGWFSDTLFVYHIGRPSMSVTRQALVKLLRQTYAGDFEKLEADFHPIRVASFDELEQGGELRLRAGGNAGPVVNRFTGELARHYYQTMHDAIRRYDEKHLILGDRYHSYAPDVVAEAAGPYVDVITTNFDWPDWTDGRLPTHYLKRLHSLSGKPILVTEYYVAADENRSGNKNSGDIFTTVNNQQDRARAVRNRVRSLALLPYVVGAHWFQYTDEPTFGRNDGEDYNFGLVDIDDKPYDEVVAAFTDVHAEVKPLHTASGARHVDGPEQTIAIPSAPSDPLSGLGHWETQTALWVGSASGPEIADLLACWDTEGLYVAIIGSRFVDPNAYVEQDLPAERERLQWRIWLNESPEREVTIDFGIGDRVSVSDPDVKCRLFQHGMRYTVIARLPAKMLGRERLSTGERIEFRTSLADRLNGTKITWEPGFKCDDTTRDVEPR